MTVDISVIVPVYNVEQYIKKCILSLMEQDCNSIEFIIVNDGSKDNSIAICEQLISNDMRFKIVNKENGGLMSAWKKGVKEAKGRYIGFVDSDDWVDPDMFSRLLSKIVSIDADIVCSGYIAENEDYSVKMGRDKEYIFCTEQIKKQFIREYCCSYFLNSCRPTICRWDKVYKKELILSNMQYFNEKVSMGEDFNANIAMLLDCNKIVLMKDFCPYHYRNNPTSIVNSINPRAFCNIVELSRTCNIIAKDKHIDSFYIDSFIGNMIFEEVKKICKMENFDKKIRSEMVINLKMCNADYYLQKYSAARKKLRIQVYVWLLRKKQIGIIRCLTHLYKHYKQCP